MGETRRPARNPKQGMTAQAVRSRPRAPKKHPAAAGRKPRIGPGGRGRA